MKVLNKISVIGLGKVGCPLLAAIASRGFEVIGVDINEGTIKKIKRGVSPVSEPLVNRYLKKYKRRIQATLSFKKAINNSQISFIIVPTPSKRDGAFSNRFLLRAIEAMGQSLKKKKDFHLVAIMSTVSPGSMENEITPALLRSTKKIIGKEIGLCYNPGFIALGRVINSFLAPDFVLIGELDRKSGDILKKFYQRFCTNQAKIARMNFINSELSKLALNTFVTTKISYANMLAELCERSSGADATVITRTIGLDRRIGQRYFKGAVAYGGPCFPRDNRALRTFSQKMKVNLPIALATDKINQKQTNLIIRLVKKNVSPGANVAILGLAYKPDTDVVEESQGIHLALGLRKAGYKVLVHDPQALKSAKFFLNNKVSYLQTLDQIKSADLLVITTAWDIYAQKLPALLRKKKIKPIIIDCWRMFESKKLAGQKKYIARGRWPA